MRTALRLALLLAAALGSLVSVPPSHAAEIRYDFQGYVQPNSGGPSLPPTAVGGSLTPLSTVSGYFSYVQEDATLSGSSSQSAFYDFAQGGQAFLTNGVETFATSSNFSMDLATYVFLWDIQALTTLTDPFGPGDFSLGIQFSGPPFPAGFPSDPIPAVPGGNATLGEFSSVVVDLAVPSPFGSIYPIDISILVTSLQGHVVPEPSVPAAIGSALVAFGLLRLRRRRV